MTTIWHIRGNKAGTFEKLSDEEARKAVESGDAQIADGGMSLAYPEGHAHYEKPKQSPAPPKSDRSKKKYPNKMMTTDENEE